MNRSFVGSLTGAGIGFLLGIVGVGVASGGEAARDTGAIVLFVGSFLAGAGAISGTVIGGVSDVRKHVHKHDETSEHETLK